MRTRGGTRVAQGQRGKLRAGPRSMGAGYREQQDRAGTCPPGHLGRAQLPTDFFTHSSSKDLPVPASGSCIPDSEVGHRALCTIIK